MWSGDGAVKRCTGRGTRTPWLIVVPLVALNMGLIPASALAASPVISSFAPKAGVVGAAVVLTGSGFTGVTAVSFSGSGAAFSVTSDGTIATSVPNGATTGPIQVTLSGGTTTSSLTSFKVKPRITVLSESSAPAGSNVLVWGSAFTQTTSVSFTGLAAGFTVNSDSQITATIPAGASSGPITVTTAGGSATSSAKLTVISPAALVVDAGRVLGPISKGLFSNNQRYKDAGTGVLDLSMLASNPTIVPLRSDIVAWAKQFGVTGLRFPGGAESTYYNWEDGIGPVLSRPRCSNRAGLPYVCNAYGIMEHMAFVEALGPDALPWTSITLGRHIRAVDAANFVEFVNSPDDGSHPYAALRAEYGHPQPYGVRYWEIGNEVSAESTVYPNVDAWLDGYSLNGVNVWDGALAIRDAMKAVDPTILVGSGWVPRGTDLYAALQARQTRFDFADVHGGLAGSGTTTFAQHYSGINAATHIADSILANQQLINSARFPAVNGMQVVSWENDAATTALRWSLHHALANAVSLTTLIADGIAFDSHTPLSALDTAPPTAGARAEDLQWSPSSPPDAGDDQYVNWYATAPSYSYDLFANYLGTTSVDTTLTNVPAASVNKIPVDDLYATAALNDQGDVLGLIVTNADYADAWPVTVDLNAFNTASGTVEQVTGTDVTSVNSQTAPDNVQVAAQPDVVVSGGGFTYTFPAHSVTAIDFRLLPAPAVTGLTPTQGPVEGGTTVVISGTGFSGATAASFGAAPAAGYSVDSDTQITATSPAGTGTVDVTVTTAGGTSTLSTADRFDYQPDATARGP